MADKEIMATGRRKTAIAVVKLVKGKEMNQIIL